MKFKKHPSLLIEVLIAIAIVSIVSTLLIFPHAYLLREQAKLIEKMDLDRVLSLLFAKVVSDLYTMQIPWSTIESGQPIEITASLLEQAGFRGNFSFQGNYQFKIKNFKPKEAGPLTLYLLELKFIIRPVDATKVDERTYLLFVKRELGEVGS